MCLIRLYAHIKFNDPCLCQRARHAKSATKTMREKSGAALIILVSCDESEFFVHAPEAMAAISYLNPRGRPNGHYGGRIHIMGLGDLECIYVLLIIHFDPHSRCKIAGSFSSPRGRAEHMRLGLLCLPLTSQ